VYQNVPEKSEDSTESAGNFEEEPGPDLITLTEYAIASELYH